MSEQGNEIGKLAAALAKAQASFLPVEKTRTVTVKMRAEKGGGSYSFSYAPLDTVLAATRPALGANGLALTQLIIHDELVTMVLHADGGVLEARSVLPKISDMQGLGGAITYLRRYAIQAILGVAAEEDDDGNAAAGHTREIIDEARAVAEFEAQRNAKRAAQQGPGKPQATDAAHVPAPLAPAGKPPTTAPERAAAAGKPVAQAATAAREVAGHPGHVKRFFAVAEELGMTEDQQKKVLAEFGIASRKDIPEAKMPAIVRRMQAFMGAAEPEPTPPGEAPAPPAKPPASAPARPALVSVFDVKRVVTKLDELNARPHAPCVSMFIGRRVNDVREVLRDELPGLLKILDACSAGDAGALKLLAQAKDDSIPF